jgi:hypothetical protein
MEHRRLATTGAVLLWLVTLCLVNALAGKKKNPDDITQTLAIPKEPPSVTVGETRRLVFHVSPLTGKGALAQQTRDALRAVLKLNGGLPVIHIRAFVAGSGDVRRIPQLVSEVFGEKKMSLPSVSLVRAGGLAVENAQIVLETISVAKRDVNPTGLDFVVAAPVTAPDPASPVKPLLMNALDQLAAKLNGEAPLAVSCFVSLLTDASELSAAIASRFPSAAVNLVQNQRGPYQRLAICEAAARGSRITSERLAFTSTRVAFGSDEKDARLAFQRLDHDLASAGAASTSAVFIHLYPLSFPIGEMSRKFCPSDTPVAVIPFEGLASIDAGFSVDAIATVSP